MPFIDDNSFAPVTAILDSAGSQVFETAGIIGVSAASSKVYAQHTLENGAPISDHSFDLPDQLTLRCILDPDDYIEVYRRIKRAFSQNTAFIIQTKVDTYSNMYIEALPHEEDRKNTIALSLDFVQQRFQRASITSLPASSVANLADSDTRSSGNKRGSEVGTQKSTTILNELLGD